MQSRDQTDEHDFGRLFARHQPRIYGFIRSLVVGRTDAEDLLQETASVLWRRFDDFQPGSNFLAWALAAARFQVMYFRQRQRNDVLRFSDKFLDAVGADTAQAAAQLGEMQELLERCMDKLPDTDRELFELRYRTDMTPRELAERLGRPQSTVYNAVNRIRRTLAECVQRAMDSIERE
jgi:RNA polymerase sigma-70 factor (ECF subfamily)